MGAEVFSKAMRYRWLIFWILAFGYVMVYFHRLCPAVVAEDMRRDLKLFHKRNFAVYWRILKNASWPINGFK